ncbi:hypothetical protein [Micromonospora sp. SL4-19]|uniref:hypothetical protein n=1 Tax=Micromonospora sp. SL4-19 TaxID=3399129 RepID=UPI003A4DC3F5
MLTEADVAGAAEALRAARIVVVQLQHPPATTLAGARCMRAAGRRVVLDGVPERHVADELVADADADVLRADAKETRLPAGTTVDDLATALGVGRDLLRRGPSLVALAVGRRPRQRVRLGGRAGHRPVGPYDRGGHRGGRDAFIAVLTAGLLPGEAPETLAQRTVAAASATVGHPGGRR